MSFSYWMSDRQSYISGVKLCDLFIPGTHDSGSYNINESSDYLPGEPKELLKIAEEYKDDLKENILNNSSTIKKFVAGWSKTQSMSIREQLRAGIRYFDFRIAPKGGNNTPWLAHCMYSVQLCDVVAQIQSFIRESPSDFKEIIIIDFQEFITDKENLFNLILATYNEMLKLNVGNRTLLVSDAVDPTSTVAEILSLGNIVTIWPKKETSMEFGWLRSSVLESPYDEDDYHSLPKIEAFLEKELKKRNKDMLFVLQGVYTPSKSQYVLSLLNPESEKVRNLKQKLPGDIDNAKQEIRKWENAIDELKWYNPADWDNYYIYFAQLVSWKATLEILKKELEFLNAITAPPDLESNAEYVNPAVDKWLFTKWARSDHNIVMLDFIKTTDVIDDMLQLMDYTPIVAFESSEDIRGIDRRDYRGDEGHVILWAYEWAYNSHRLVGSMPLGFDFSTEKKMPIVVFDKEYATWQDVACKDIGVHNNLKSYNGNAGEVIRKTYLWGRHKYTAAIPNFECWKGKMGVIGLSGSAIKLLYISSEELGLKNKAKYYDSRVAEAIEKTYLWGLKNGYIAAFPNFDFDCQFKRWGVICIKSHCSS